MSKIILNLPDNFTKKESETFTKLFIAKLEDECPLLKINLKVKSNKKDKKSDSS